MTRPARPPRPPLRADGADTREKLVHTALRLFAEKGFANTSTREISEAAGVNLASIGYYFGDKLGLYRAAFFEPLGECDMPHQVDIPADMPPGAMLEVFYRQFLEPLKQGEVIRQCMQLHFREMVDPVGVWQEVIDGEIKPQHAMLVRYLSAYLGVDEDGVDVHRLAFSLAGLAVHMFVGREMILGLRPDILDTPAAIDALAERLALYGEAMIDAERRRLQSAKPAATRKASARSRA